MGTDDIQIYDIMACNVYWDFENSPMPKETHKMLVALYPTPGVMAPDLIEAINAYGPGGYHESFAPSKTKPLSQGALLKDVELSWSTLKDVADLDAYYVTRFAQASTPMAFDGNNLIHYDNIYAQRIFNNDPDAGLNRSQVVVQSELNAQTDYGYFVEITDANVGGQANICVFQPHQFFKTP